MQVCHDSQKTEYRTPAGACTAGSSVEISILADPAQEVVLRTWENESGEKLYPMQKDGAFFRYTLSLPENPGLLWYYFIVTEENGHVFFYGNREDSLGGEGCGYGYEPPSFQITVYEYAKSPDWFKKSIYYQIFPDRFYRDKDSEEWCEWGKPPAYDKNPDGSIKHWDFYGGSLKGIQEKLPYLSMLGIGAVYLNPIFEAVSNHRYDTSDYMKIDPRLGTKEDFTGLCRAAKEYGIGIILDGVFSHTGINSRYFREHPEWYTNENGEISYWWGVKDLPEVNELHPSFTEHICGRNGVVRSWIRAGARGFRLDVADELPDRFIELVREAIKAEDPDAVLIGEVWEDASNKFSHGEKRKYFMGRELDSVMNYPLRSMLLDFMLEKCNASALSRRFESLRENYPEENFMSCLNLIGSHDRERVLSVLGFGTDPHGDYVAVQKLKALAAVQYAMPGVPGIYYGDEAGLTGGADPENRACYPWGKENGELLYCYRMLGHIYKEHSVLADGDFKIVDLADDLFCFARQNEKETILVVCNRTPYNKEYSLKNHSEFSKYGYALDLIKSDEKNIEASCIAAYSTQYLLLKKSGPNGNTLKKAAGVICALSSVSDPYKFIDFLAEGGIKIWQLLPVNPKGPGNCPYLSTAVFAADPDYIDRNDLPALDNFEQFKKNNIYWIKDYVNYEHKRTGKSVSELELDQYYFDEQWKKLKKYANSKGIRLFGDIPIYTSPNGADVEAHPECFQIDELGKLKARSGVPPDYFQKEGQDWGNPLYNWNIMKADGYTWWKNRLKQCLDRFDYVRLDHFRSFSEYYAIPAGKTAKEGYWQKGPGLDFFEALGDMKDRIIAEDLGALDDEVFNLLKLTGIPGMNVWQFSSDEMMNMDADSAASRVFYSGTHDNNTLLGWLRESNREASKTEAKNILDSLWKSKAPWVIIQLQDMLFLGEEARMNVPGTPEGNWSWKLDEKLLTKECSDYFRALSERYDR